MINLTEKEITKKRLRFIKDVEKLISKNKYLLSDFSLTIDWKQDNINVFNIVKNMLINIFRRRSLR